MSYAVLRHTFKDMVVENENGEVLEGSRNIDTLWMCEYNFSVGRVYGRHVVYIQSSDGKWRIYGIYMGFRDFKENDSLEDVAKHITAITILEEHQRKRLDDCYLFDTRYKEEDIEAACKFDIYTEDLAVIERFMEENDVVPYKQYKNENPVILAKPGKLFHVTAKEAAKVLDIIPIPVKTDVGMVANCEIWHDNLMDEQKWLNRNNSKHWLAFSDGTYAKDLTEWYNEHFFTEYTIRGNNYEKAVLPRVIKKAKEIIYNVETADSSILISKYAIEANFNTEEERLIVDISKTGELYYNISREGNYCKKIGKRTEKEVSPLEFFNVNSKTITNPEGCYCFGESEDAHRWFLDNIEFCKRSGFFNYVAEAVKKSEILTELILYVSVIFEYPSIELLVKTGYVKLVEDFFSKLKRLQTKDNIATSLKNLEELVDRDATKGHLVLRFPKYIGDYLKQTHASISTYRFWRDIYELENISKENFDKFIGMPERVLLNISVREDCDYDGWERLGFQNIIKYDGYNLIKTLKYMSKFASSEGIGVKNGIQTLSDTLRMAEYLNMEIPRYPDNLLQIHDELSEIISKKRIAADENILKKTADTCTEVVNKAFASNAVTLPKNAMKNLTFKFPATKAEFVAEGINQHNCVAGYASRVTRGECIIFFVRKIDSPNTSYITAELWESGQLNQVMYSNNRPVSHFLEDYKYCEHIAAILKNAYKRGEVFAFKEAEEQRKNM